MHGDQTAIDFIGKKSHAEFFRLGPIGKNFGVSRLGNSGGLQCFFVGRAGGHGMDELGKTGIDCLGYISIGGVTRGFINHARFQETLIDKLKVEDTRLSCRN